MAKKKKISVTIRNHPKIIAELQELDELIFLDILSALYTDRAIQEDFGKYIENCNVDSINFSEYAIVIAKRIVQKDKLSKIILDVIIKKNDKYLRASGYLELNFEQLKREIEKGLLPSLYKKGVVAEMILLHKFVNGVFDGEEIGTLKEIYKGSVKKSKELSPFEIKIKSTGNLWETGLQCYTNEKAELDENQFKEIPDHWPCEYRPTEKQFNNVPRGLLLFFYLKFEKLMKDQSHIEDIVRVIQKHIRSVNSFAKQQRALIVDRLTLKDRNLKLSRKIRTLQEQINTLSNKPSQKTTRDTEKDNEIAELKKDNYYLRTRIEQLEAAIANLEEEKRINQEIKDDVVIDAKKVIEIKKPNAGDYYTIVISGGKWNSKTREKVTETFRENEIIFIPADRTIRNIDTIGNADLVIFDTSHHAHDYYNIIKRKSLKLLHINRSSPDEIIGLFEPETTNILS